MALRQLILSRQIADYRTQLTALDAEDAKTKIARDAWKIREAKAEKALAEITEKTSKEDRAAFDAEAAEIEAQRKALAEAEAKSAATRAQITTEINTRQNELDKLNTAADEAAKAPAPVVRSTGKEGNMPEITTAYSTREARIADMCRREDVKKFLVDFRNIRASGVTNAAVLVPDVMLGLVRQDVAQYSRLIGHINLRPCRGNGKMNLAGTVPEAFWTDAVAPIGKTSISFYQITVDDSKVAAYVVVPNSELYDSDISLATEIIAQLGQATGKALDRAILYGTGTNMPKGIMTRLGLAASPVWWGTKAPAFTNCTSHIGKLSADTVSGTKLFGELMAVLGLAKHVYMGAGGDKFWAMNETTWTQLEIQLLTSNAAGAIVTGAALQMPIIGGAVVDCDIIPDGTIIGGYGDNYLLAQREGINFAMSDQVQFVEDNTLYRATSRYDGLPLAGEAFAAFSINTTAPATTSTFPTAG